MLLNRSFSGIFLLGLIVWFAGGCAGGPEPRADEAIRKYEGMPGVYAFRLPPALLGLAVSDETSADVKDFLSSMETIKVILVNKTETHEKVIDNFMEDFRQVLRDDGFEDLLIMNDGGDHIMVKIHQNGDKIDEAMVLIAGTDEFLGLSLVGNIDPAVLDRVVHEISTDDFNINHSGDRLNTVPDL